MVHYLYMLKEVNQMEREMCSYLEWTLHVEAAELEAFSQHVRKEYGKDCPAVPPQWVASVGSGFSCSDCSRGHYCCGIRDIACLDSRGFSLAGCGSVIASIARLVAVFLVLWRLLSRLSRRMSHPLFDRGSYTTTHHRPWLRPYAPSHTRRDP
jgi:hypothetical protein